MSKKRAPIEQLLEAGKIAKQMLQDKGLEARKSVLDDIIKKKDGTVLPGIPVYLPHQWTIKAAQRIMYDILLMWKAECSDNGTCENVSLFFGFLITQLREQEKEYEKEVKAQPTLIKSLKEVPLLKDVFSPVRKRDNIKAIQRFFVDSFAVSIVLKNNHSTSEFANWFVDWTQDLYSLWLKPKDRDKMTRV